MLTKPLTLVIAVLLSFTLLFGYLSYTFYSNKKVAEFKLKETIASMQSLQESYDKQAKSCLIADQINTELSQENKKLVEEKESILDKINNLPSKPTQIPKVSKNEVDIDARLPDDVIGLLNESYHGNKGESNADAR